MAVDQVSKFAFAAFLKKKKDANVIQGFKTIINEIREKQKENIFTQTSDNILFQSDYGEEFKFKKVVNFIQSLNSKIIQIGSPNISKLGIVERAIRTLQEKMAFYLDDIYNRNHYKKYFRKRLKIYNNDYHSFLKMSPSEYIKSSTILKDPWNMYNKNKKFNYNENKKQILIKLKKVKKEFKIMQPVRRKRLIKSVYKRSHYSNWSDEIFFIDGFKIPLLKDENIGIYLIDRNGKKKEGITYTYNLKKVILPNHNKIKKIIVKLKKKKNVKVFI